MSNYQELKQEETKQRELLAKKREEMQSFEEASNRILKDIDKRKQVEHDKLTKTIKRHFAGVEVDVQHSEFSLVVEIEGFEKLHMEYQIFNSTLKKEIADKIVEEYNEFYGEVKKESDFEGLRVVTSDDIAKMIQTF